MQWTVRVLGPLEVTYDGRPVQLGTPKQRLVFGVLVANGGGPVSVDRLIDAVWGDEPPARAEASLQSYVSNLRRILEPDRPRGAAQGAITRDPAGYRLDLGRFDVDADRFRVLADEGHEALRAGDAATARASLAEALALWRGEAYGDLASNLLVLPEASRLDELGWRATEDRWTAELALGRHASALPEIQVLVRRVPLREQVWALLAEALDGCGRRVEALRAVREGMDVLRDETGLEPGPELTALEERLLDEQATPVRASRIGGTGPAGIPPRHEVARRVELDTLDARRADAAAGRGGAAVLSGEPGIGKTHLARALGDLAAADDWLVAWGRCPDASDVPGLWPLRQVVGALLDGLGLPASDLLAEPGRLGPLLDPGVAASGPGAALPGDAALDAPASSFALAVSLVDLLTAAAAHQPVLVVVDDAHWADSGTLRVLRHVVAGIADARVLVVITHRVVEPGQRAELEALRNDVARAPGGQLLSLEGLDVEGVRALLTEAAGDMGSDGMADVAGDDDALADLQRRTGGNPFFVRELARSGDRRPAGVREVVLRRLGELPPSVRPVLDALAVGGEHGDLRTLAEVVGEDLDPVLEAMDAAAVAGVVVPDDRPGRYRFAHDLIRETLVDELGAGVRARLHLAFASAIEQRWADDDQHLAARAWHLRAASPYADPAEVLAVVRRAAEAASDADRLDEAVERWRWAAELLDQVGDAATRAEVLAALGRAMSRAGDVGGARPSLVEAARGLVRLGRWEDAADALTTTGDLSIWVVTGFGVVDQEVVHLLRRALDELPPGDAARRAAVSSRLAIELYYTDDQATIDALFAQALDLARRSGQPRLHAVVLSQILAGHQRPGRYRELLGEIEELRGLGSAAEHAPGEIELITALAAGQAHLRLGQADESAEAIRAADRLASGTALPYLASQLQWYGVTRLVLAGHLDAAEAAWAEASAFYDRIGGLEPLATSMLCLLAIRMEQGRLAEELEGLRPLASGEDRASRTWGEVYVTALLEVGDTAEARSVAARLDRATIDPDWVWLAATTLRAWNRIRLGADEAYPDLLEQLRPHTGEVAVTGQLPPFLGAVDLFLGLMEAGLGDDAAAEAHLRAAVELNETLGARAWEARARRGLAAVIERVGAPGAEEAAALCARARELAEQVGNPGLSEELDRGLGV